MATAEARRVPGVGSDVVSDRELVVLGTASQAPTRSRNHNGYLLRWDGEGLLFDPGEGTQRQMIFAGVTASQITRICITHFHGDHCLGLPGVLQRMSLDRVPHVVDACYPAQNQEVFTRLRHAALFHDVVNLRERPVTGGGTVIGPRGDPAQQRRAVTIQARESNQTPSLLRCAASAPRSRPSARSAAVGSSRFSASLVQAKPRTHSRAAATSGP
jgi:ribonuclease BN (tRNA processing enzyme)